MPEDDEESLTLSTSTAVVTVFVKLPRPGFVKTRLAAGVGAERAAKFYRACAERTVDVVSRYEERGGEKKRGRNDDDDLALNSRNNNNNNKTDALASNASWPTPQPTRGKRSGRGSAGERCVVFFL